ncbi:MAG: ATPase [Thermodesulfobacteriota bacterium]
MIIGDFGTSYCKLLELDCPRTVPEIYSIREISHDLQVSMATGHNGRRFSTCYTNELTALARGGEELIKARDYVLLDCGSRDIKFIKYKNGKLEDMGWNAECGASMGFTIELLERYYNLDYSQLPVPDKAFPVTCGVLGISSIFDAVTTGSTEKEAVAKFIKGIALNAYRFAGSPEAIYLSGGLCDNPLFVNSFPCRLIPLGRFVLLTGLVKTIRQKKNGFKKKENNQT